jgi:hypothetical protein
MRRRRFINSLSVLMVAFVALVLAPSKAAAHCDGLDGPVVRAAQNALRIGDVNLALVWVGRQRSVKCSRKPCPCGS